MPLRPGFEPRPYAPREGKKRVLVIGGSQGAQALNEVVPLALAKIAETLPIEIVHQAGRDRDAAVRETYDRSGLASAEVVPFLGDVAARMGAADLVVARAGAVTVAEIAAIGRAAVLIPFPHAADDHQAKNAMALAELGGAICLRQEAADEARLGAEIAALLADDPRRVRMADAAREHGRPRAAEDIARDLLELAGIAVRSPKAQATPEPPKTNGATNGSSKFKIEIAPDRKETS